MREMQKKRKNIGSIVKEDLCTGCGTCVAVCPRHAIKMNRDCSKHVFLPVVAENACTACGICVKVCPGHEVNFEDLNRRIFGKSPPSSLENTLLGNHLGCYTGYSRNRDVRYSSASGGLVTQLLLFALEKGIIDGALITRMNESKPLDPSCFIARTSSEILESARSKYCPVPANVALEEILRKKGKYAIVGLPCHIHGLRKAEELFKELRERIVLRLGIFCSHTDTLLETEYLLYRLGVRADDVAKIDYRGKGWPGMLSLKLRSGKNIDIPFHDWIKIHAYCLFSPSRCLLCCDHSVELADISFADAWLPEFSGDKMGTSIAVARSSTGIDILRQAESEGAIALNEIGDLKVAESQKMMRFKKNSVVVRFLLYRALGKRVPAYTVKLLKPSLVDWPRSAIIFVNRFVASKPSLWGSLERISRLQDPLEKMYKKALRFS